MRSAQDSGCFSVANTTRDKTPSAYEQYPYRNRFVWISEAFRLFPFLQQYYRSAIGKLKGEGEKKLRTRGEKDVKSQAMYQRRGEDQGEVTLQVRLKQGVS